MKIAALSLSSFRREARAFTLIEVLIAVVVFAIVLAAINSVFYGALRLRNQTTKHFDKKIPIQQALATLRRDLSGIVTPGGVLSGSLMTDPSTSASSTGSSAGGGLGSTLGSLLGSTLGDPVSPELFTNSGTIDETSPWADIQKVVYYLREPTNRFAANGRDLIRTVQRNLLAATQETPDEQWLLGGVEMVEFLFFSGTEWQPSWDSTAEETPLPKAIKVRLQLAREDERRSQMDEVAPLELIVPLTVQARTNQTSTSSTGQAPSGGGR
ncbi:MAG: type II secretion system protein GspJ [Verrucomicrobiota bacterium]